MKLRRTLIAGTSSVLLAAAVVALAGCSDDSHSAGGAPTGSTCPTSSTLDYDSFGRAFMEAYCTDCHGSSVSGDARHGAPSDHNFDTLAGIQGMAAHIDQQAGAGPNAVNTLMPPSEPRPTEAERRQLGEWLACGAP